MRIIGVAAITTTKARRRGATTALHRRECSRTMCPNGALASHARA